MGFRTSVVIIETDRIASPREMIEPLFRVVAPLDTIAFDDAVPSIQPVVKGIDARYKEPWPLATIGAHRFDRAWIYIHSWFPGGVLVGEAERDEHRIVKAFGTNVRWAAVVLDSYTNTYGYAVYRGTSVERLRYGFAEETEIASLGALQPFEARVLATHPAALDGAEYGEELVFELLRDLVGWRLDEIPEQPDVQRFTARI